MDKTSRTVKKKEYLPLLAGFGIGVYSMILLIWIIGSKDKPQMIPLNPELIRFWEKSLEQKDIELVLPGEIKDKISIRG